MNSYSHLHDKFDLVVIGCSVGGIEALKIILSELPSNFKVPIAIVQHRSSDSNSMLIRYFSELCDIAVVEPEDKQPIAGEHIYFAPANYHLMIAGDKRFNLSVEEPVFYSRPSIDVLFMTAAQVYNERVVGIVLSGANSDGAKGLKEIKNRGGYAVVQDPRSAFQAEMPAAAAQQANPDLLLSLLEIKEFIYAL